MLDSPVPAGHKRKREDGGSKKHRGRKRHRHSLETGETNTPALEAQNAVSFTSKAIIADGHKSGKRNRKRKSGISAVQDGAETSMPASTSSKAEDSDNENSVSPFVTAADIVEPTSNESNDACPANNEASPVTELKEERDKKKHKKRNRKSKGLEEKADSQEQPHKDEKTDKEAHCVKQTSTVEPQIEKKHKKKRRKSKSIGEQREAEGPVPEHESSVQEGQSLQQSSIADLQTEKKHRKKRGKSKGVGGQSQVEEQVAEDANKGQDGKCTKDQSAEPVLQENSANTPVSVNRSHKGPEDQSKPSKSKRSKRKKQQTVDDTMMVAPDTATSQKSKVLKKSKSEKSRKSVEDQPIWSMSEAIGGWFLSHDPVFSPDEKYLMLANPRGLQVYATSTSLLEHSLNSGSGQMSAFALSASNTRHAYSASTTGLLALWDWENGTKIARWGVGTHICQMATASPMDLSYDLIFAHERQSHQEVINVYTLPMGDHASQSESRQILKKQSAIVSFDIVSDGDIVVIACKKSLIIGRKDKTPWDVLKDVRYTFWEIKLTHIPTTMSAHLRSGPGSNAPLPTKQQKQARTEVIDVAVGDEEGKIYVFEDVMSKLLKLGKDIRIVDETDILMPRRLHWHRNAVGSLKWSKDGNYIISGGKETVLVIWQLATGKHQQLPHLSSAIENIVVSPNGASYALSLANNSVIVLSTSELKAKTNITGIQSRRVDVHTLKSGSKFLNSSPPFEAFHKVPMDINPQTPSQLLLAVPSAQPRNEQVARSPEPYLQTFDLSTAHHVSRQALTRNNATDFNTGPNHMKILEPRITHLQLSHDGLWLATIEEWTPPHADLEHLEEGDPATDVEEQSLRREVFLKFWSWNKSDKVWKLDARIDAPHPLHDVGAPSHVFDLISNPASNGFATIGGDRCVRVWTPKTRFRDGMVVRGSDASGFVTWSTHRSIELPGKPDTFDAETSGEPSFLPSNGCLAFSADGSVLAASLSWPSESESGLVHIVDVEEGIVAHSIPEIHGTGLARLAILGSHLIVVGDSVVGWDLVNDQLVYAMSFDLPGTDRANRASMLHLATNDNDGTYAVSFPAFDVNLNTKHGGKERYIKKAQSKVLIFDPAKSTPISYHNIPNVVLSLAAARNRKGYIALDSAAEIRILSPKASPSIQFIDPDVSTNAALQAQPSQDVIMEDEDDLNKDDHTGIGSLTSFARLEDVVRDTENDKPVVRPEQLQQVFDSGPSHALPPVKDMFSAIVGLYARKRKY